MPGFRLFKQDPAALAKRCAEEVVSSAVEVLSEDEDQPPEASALFQPEAPGNEVFPDYVTLSTDFLLQCSRENAYIYECETGGGMAEDERCPSPGDDGSPGRSHFVNRSYLPVAEPADTSDSKKTAVAVSGNLYSNSPCS